MARPQKIGLDYFPHDTDASSDPKLEPLLMLHGAKGYGFYFLMLEYIYRSDNFRYDISDADTIQILCRKMSLSKQEFDSILETCLKYHCFNVEEYKQKHCLTSNGIMKRAQVVIKKREKMREEYESDHTQ